MNLPAVSPYEDQAIDVIVNVFNRAKCKLGFRQNLAQLAKARRKMHVVLHYYLLLHNKVDNPTALEELRLCVPTRYTRGADVSRGPRRLHRLLAAPERLHSVRAHNATTARVITLLNDMLAQHPDLDIDSRKEFDAHIKVSLQGLKNPLAKQAEKLIVDTISRKWGLTSTFVYILRFSGTSRDESASYFYFEAVFSQPCEMYPIPQAVAVVYFRVADKLIEPPENKNFALTFRVEGHHSDHDMRYVALSADWLLAVIKMKIKLFKRIEKINWF